MIVILVKSAIYFNTELRDRRGNASHSGMLSTIAELPCVHTIHELIA